MVSEETAAVFLKVGQAVFHAGKCPQTSAGIASHAQVIIFQQRRKLPEKLSSKEFQTAIALSSFLIHGNVSVAIGKRPRIASAICLFS